MARGGEKEPSQCCETKGKKRGKLVPPEEKGEEGEEKKKRAQTSVSVRGKKKEKEVSIGGKNRGIFFHTSKEGEGEKGVSIIFATTVRNRKKDIKGGGRY